MYKIIVFTHGSLAECLVRTSRLILGNQPDIETYCVEPGCNLEAMRDGVEPVSYTHLHHRNNDLQKYVKSKSYKKYFLTIPCSAGEVKGKSKNFKGYFGEYM